MISKALTLIHTLSFFYDLKEPSAELVRKTIAKCGKTKAQLSIHLIHLIHSKFYETTIRCTTQHNCGCGTFEH